jgi:hypothetical protein
MVCWLLGGAIEDEGRFATGGGDLGEVEVIGCVAALCCAGVLARGVWTMMVAWEFLGQNRRRIGPPRGRKEGTAN